MIAALTVWFVARAILRTLNAAEDAEEAELRRSLE